MEKKISIISTFAEDRITYLETGKRKTAIGGPAFWITKALRKLRTPYSLISPHKRAITNIVAQGGEETGSLVFVPKIKIGRNLKGNFIISTLADEFELGKIRRLVGFVALDIQGYARVSKKQIPLTERVAESIPLLKATREEIKKLDKRVAASQKKRILIVTKGNQGFDIYKNGKMHSFASRPVKTKDTLGAGDSFLSAFVVEYLKNGDHLKAARFAQKYVENFLRKNK